MKGMKRICSLLLFTLLISASVMSVNAAEKKNAKKAEKAGQTITVKWPGEGQDASPAIQEAIAKADRVSGSVTIKFEKNKQYDVWPETSYHTTGYYISNSATRTENPNGERWSAILLKNMENVTVDGNDSLLMIHGVMTPVLIDESENITLKNFNLDYARPTVSEFLVEEKTDNYVKIKVHEDSLYELQDTNSDGKFDNIHWLGEKKKSNENERYWNSNATLMQELDPNNETLRRISMYGWGNNITDLGNNVLKLEFANGNSYKQGFTYQVRDGVRNQVGTFIHRSENVTFIDSKFHYLHGLGIVGQYSENLTFTNIECAPRKGTGRTCAGFADFMQMSGCKGEISVTDSLFSGNHDDTFNIHGTHLRIVEKDDANHKIKVRFMHPQSWGFQAFESGDEIEFIDGNKLIPYQKNVVKSYNRINDTDIELTLEDALPSNIQMNFDAVENITWTPDVTIKNNISKYVPTRGVLCTTRGKVLIEGNTFYKQGMAAILLEDDARGWYESGLIRDMTIKNNEFVDCVSPQIHSNPQTAVKDPEQTVHSNISVIGNTFTGQTVNINAISTKNLTVKDNKFPETGGNVSLDSCNGVEINDNVNQKNVSASNTINERSFADFKVKSIETVETIDRTGMTATTNYEKTGYEVSKIIDGDTNTIWHTDWESNLPTESPYVVIDLNGSKTFNRLCYTPRQKGNGGNVKAYELWIKEKVDDAEFVKVAEGSGWSSDGSEKYIEFDEPLTAEVVKFVIVDSIHDSSNRWIASGAEIDFQNVSKNAETIPIGKNITLNYTAVGENGIRADLEEAEFSYASENKKIAKVNKNGVITGVGSGTTAITMTVTAYGKTLSDKVSITVSEEKYNTAESIEIAEIDQGASAEIQMSAKVNPADAAEDVRWKIKMLNGAGASIDENTGLLKINGEGRALVTAYSKNNPEIKDSVNLLFNEEKVQTSRDWEWVRENPAKWEVDENGHLNITMERAAIWAENSAKNILLTSASEEDFEVVAKMNFKPQKDYTEAGIVMYVDDENYVVLSRKVHPGYRPDGKNIFSMLSRVDGAPWESPAEKKINDDLGDIAYLKLKKEGNNYSGYYSDNGTDWTPIYEDRTVDLGGIPKAGIIGYVAFDESETAVYEEMEIDGEKCLLEELRVLMSAEKAEITAIESANTRKVELGTTFEEIRLPKTVKVTWNDKYEEAVPVEWIKGDYNESEIQAYTLEGRLQGIDNAVISTEQKACVQIIVVADKEELAKQIYNAKCKQQTIYTEESWTKFVNVLSICEGIYERDDAKQVEVNAATQKLQEAMNDLEILVTYQSLQDMLVEANTIIEQTKDILYKEDLNSEERQNGYYSEERQLELIGVVEETTKLVEEFKVLEELGVVDEVLTDEERTQMIEIGNQLSIATEVFKESKIQISTEGLQIILADAEQLIENNYTPESWKGLKTAIDKAKEMLESGVYTEKALGEIETEILQCVEKLKRIYKINIPEFVGGKILSEPEDIVEEGGTVTFKVSADEGYKLEAFYINGEKVEIKGGEHVISGVSANINVSAKFVLNDDGSGEGSGDGSGDGSGEGTGDGSGSESGSGNGNQGGNKPNGGGNNANQGSNPQTGDDSMVSVISFSMLMAISAVLIVVMTVYKKKARK